MVERLMPRVRATNAPVGSRPARHRVSAPSHFNDTRCGSVAELRVVILKARRLADDDAERERAAAVVKTWLLDQIDKKRAAPTEEPFAPECLAA
jgi:hypothetical protein